MSMDTHRQRPESTNGEEITAETSDESTGSELTMESLVAKMIQSETGDLRTELDDLKREIEEVNDFARISLNERKIKQNEANLSEFSDSLTGFAEKAFNNINAIQDRLDVQSLLLAAIVDALDDEGVELDMSLVERYRQESVVTDTSPEEKLEASLDDL